MQTAVAYIRTSTLTQNLSAEAQKDQIIKFAALNNIKILDFYQDLGASGATSNRLGLKQALSIPADFLIVSSRDRLARNRKLIKDIQKQGIQILSADGQNTSLADLIAEKELHHIKTRTSNALAVKKSKNERVGQLPYGYKLALDNIHLIKDDKEQYAITEVLSLRALGKTYRSIVKECNNKGFLSRTGNPLGLTQIVRICNNNVNT